jgi:hypothetical protein
MARRLAFARRLVLAWLAVASALLAGGLLAGCAGSQATDGADADEAAADPAARHPLGLAPSADDVHSVQLYRADERQLPLLRLDSGDQLTLEFDLLGTRGRPLSAYFFHADRTWRRDLAPSQYLDGFQNDNLLNYQPSRGTDVRYVHYEYAFPNDAVRFLVSGNYVVRVTEQGRRDAILFERAFFVSEQAGPVEIGVERIVESGQRRPSELPIAEFTPPAPLRGDPFRHATCYVRNGDVAAARCSDRPRMGAQPALRFEMGRRDAFAPSTAEFFADLTDLRVGGEIERIDPTVQPPFVLLEPDFARFAGDPGQPLLNGQLVIEDGSTLFEPDLAAEYATVRFAFVPDDEQPLDAEIVVAGTFNGGRYDERLRMRWEPLRGRYEGDVLLKQGQYHYVYRSRDPRLRDVLRQSLPPAAALYSAFVYYDDPRLGSDRLLAVQTTRVP